MHDAVGVGVPLLQHKRKPRISFPRLLDARADELDERDADLLPGVGHGAAASGIAPRTTASAMRATRAISLTSCTRTMSAPLAIAIATVAAVPSRRSSTGRPPSTLPIVDLREVPVRIGRPRTRSSP